MEILLFLLFQFLSHCRALFTVEMKPHYQAEFHENVTLECRFPPGDGKESLSVFWRRLSPLPSLELYKMVDSKRDVNLPDSPFRGRVWVNEEELSKGRALLQISDLRINDSGRYQCLVEMGAGDYKQTVLTVQASYRNITATALQSCLPSPNPLVLQCQAKGFPKAQVQWTDASNHTLASFQTNTSYTMSHDGLYAVTATVRVNATCGEAYNCIYITDQNAVSASIFLLAPSTDQSEKFPILYVMLMLLGCFLVMILCASAVFKKRCFGLLQGIHRRQNYVKRSSNNEPLPILNTPGPVGNTEKECGEDEF